MKRILILAVVVASLGVAAGGAATWKEPGPAPIDRPPMTPCPDPSGAAVLVVYSTWGFTVGGTLTVHEDGRAELTSPLPDDGARCLLLPESSLRELRLALREADLAGLPPFDTSPPPAPEGVVIETGGHTVSHHGSAVSFTDGDTALPERLLRVTRMLSEIRLTF